MPELTHVDAAGNARMVDVGDKAVTARVAIATGWISLSEEAFAAVIERRAAKGDVLTIAQIAGIGGAKRAAEWIPLAHPLPLSGVTVDLAPDAAKRRIVATATVRTDWKTGVEMEALTAVSAALLTVYDMLKAVDRGMALGGICLLEKRGGKSGTWLRPSEGG